jgi:Protein of unknown function (DUF2798)
MRVNAKHSNLLFAFFMSVLMALLMSGVLTAIHLGFTPDFIGQWLHSFVLAWPIAFPSILLIAPVVRKIVVKLTEQA